MSEQERPTSNEERTLRRLREMMSGGNRNIRDIAELLGAEEFLHEKTRTDKHGQAETYLEFDAEAWLQDSERERVPIQIPDSYSFRHEVILPPGSGGFVSEGQGNEFQEKKLFQRIRLLAEVLGELNLHYKVIDGEVSPDMMRKHSYKCFVIEAINKLVFVNNEEDNATYIVHDSTDADTYLKKTKDDLKKLIPEEKISFVAWSSPETWKATLKNILIPSQENPRPESDSERDRFTYTTIAELARELGVQPPTIDRRIKNIEKELGDEIVEVLPGPNNVPTRHIPDYIAKIIRLDLAEYAKAKREAKPAPSGWMAERTIAKKFGVNKLTIRKWVHRIKAEMDESDWAGENGQFLDEQTGKLESHLSPFVIDQLRTILQEHIDKKAEAHEHQEGWMTQSEVLDALKTVIKSRKIIAEKWTKLQEQYPDQFVLMFDRTRDAVIHASPDMVNRLTAEIKEALGEIRPEGWMTVNRATQRNKIEQNLFRRMLEKEAHPDEVGEFRDPKTNKVRVHYSPEAIERSTAAAKTYLASRRIVKDS